MRGGSLIIHTLGNVLAGPLVGEEDLVSPAIDLDERPKLTAVAVFRPKGDPAKGSCHNPELTRISIFEIVRS